ncbi:MAG: 4Fe-4S binding protein [Deltaproteobacteria bacterium]|nr:4Fe-4S binding protein [Deltaproteobacteria bacterium]MBW2355000.1 4Fe-4S binding protein [Deltaproteobacteria bacterium]
MKVLRKIIEIDEELCDGCGQCVPSCAEGAIEIVDGKARIVAEKYCDGLGACMGECPTGALRIVEREAEDFDEAAVEEYLKQKEEKSPEIPTACGCPSTQIQTFAPPSHGKETVAGNSDSGRTSSSLEHWPVQINLIPPIAPFLKGADLLVAADCVPVAYPNFHQDFLKGKVVMVGCPKFDDVEEYIRKFTNIFKMADIKSITTLVMEVPCCSALPVIIQRAMDAAGKKIPVKQVVISTRGEILSRG